MPDNITDRDVARWLDQLDRAGHRLDAAARDHADTVARVRGDDSRSGKWKSDQLDRARTDATGRIDADERLAVDALDALDAHGAGTVRDRDDTAALLREQREGRAWQRAQARLARGESWQRIAADADRDQDVATLAALRDESAVIAGTDEGVQAVRQRADVGLARAGAGEQSSRARARVLAGPLRARLDTQVSRAQMHVQAGTGPNRPGQPGDSLGAAFAGRYARGQVDALREALDAGPGTPVPGAHTADTPATA